MPKIKKPPRGLPARLVRARKHARLKAIDMAAACRISPAYLSQIENGSRMPSSSLVAKMATILVVDVKWLLHGTGNNPALSRHLRMVEEVAKFARRNEGVAPANDHEASRFWRKRAVRAEASLAKITQTLRKLAASFAR